MTDTLTRHVPQSLGVKDQLWTALMEAICARRGHSWRLYGRALDANGEWNLAHGRRDYCTRCLSGRVVFREDEAEVVASKAEIMALEPRFGEALYEARWGDRPRQRFNRGEWPAV